MNVLLIGGTGFIGARVARRLSAGGHAVTVFHRGKTESDLPGGVRHLHGDRDRLAEHAGALRDAAPQVVLDVVPYTEAHAETLADVFGGTGARVAALSSADVYRNYDGFRGESDHTPDPAPLGEDAPLRETRFPYRGFDGLDFAYAEDYDKRLVEEALRDAPGLPATLLRLPAVYGPGDAQRRLRPWLRRMFDERPAILLGEAEARFRWTHGYVENVAAAVAQAVTDERTAGRTFNVGERRTPTVAERVRRLGEAVGWDGEVVALPREALPAHLRTPYGAGHSVDYRYPLATDTQRLYDVLDFTPPVSTDDALRQSADWERQNAFEDTPPPDYAAEDAALG